MDWEGKVNVFKIRYCLVVFAVATSLLTAEVCLAGKDQVVEREIISGAKNFLSARIADRAEFIANKRLNPIKLRRIRNKDGSWSHRLPRKFDKNMLLKGKLVTWRYVGQAHFSDNPQPATSPRQYVVRPSVKLSLRQRLKQLKRIDAQGRIWKVAAVDMNRWKASFSTAGAELEKDNFVRSSRLQPIDRKIANGTIESWTPMSWTAISNCDDEHGKDLYLWDGDSRLALNPLNYTRRQQAAVNVSSTMLSGSYMIQKLCSGVIVAQNRILTAAHCVNDDENHLVPASSVNVCQDKNRDGVTRRECLTASGIDVPDSYSGGDGKGRGSDPGDDWAIIEVSGAWISPVEEMSLSSASDDTIMQLTNVHNLSFPRFAPGCESNSLTLYHNQEFEPVASVSNKKVRLKVDASKGQSGSPIYYCPEGNNNVCGSGEKGFVIAVLSGWKAAEKRVVGPKVSKFRKSALVFIND